MCKKTIYSDAVQVQDASNIIAVSNLLADTIRELRHQDYLDCRQIAEHPAVILIASKIASMIDVENLTVYCDAYQECKRLEDN